MNELITLSKLTAGISDATGYDKPTCEKFVRTFTAVVSQGLSLGESIRIRGFGQFIVIRRTNGQCAVEFIPDAYFNGRVNAKYAHLKPQYQQPQQQTAPPQYQQPQQQTAPPQYQQPQQPAQPRYQQQPAQPQYQQPQQLQYQQPAQPQYQQPAQPRYQQQPAQPQYQQPAQPQYQPDVPLYRQIDRQQQPPQPREPAAPEPQPAQSDRPLYQQLEPRNPHIITPADTTSTAPQQPVAPFEPPTTYQPEPPSQPIQPQPVQPDTEPHSDIFEEETTKRTKYAGRALPKVSETKKVVIASLLFLAVGFVLGYLTARYLQDDPRPYPVPDSNPSAQTDVIAPQDSISKNAEMDFNESKQSIDTDDEPLVTLENETDDTPVIEIKKGESLQSISKREYGRKEYWVYIYFENKDVITNPTIVQPGTKLRIAPRSKYDKSDNEEENLEWAKQESRKIESQFAR